MEDVEYLYLLAEIGRSADARRLCREVVISADVFWRDPARYEKVKAEAAELILKGIRGAVARRTVTYDLERQMDGATLVSCSGFARALVENM